MSRVFRPVWLIGVAILLSAVMLGLAKWQQVPGSRSRVAVMVPGSVAFFDVQLTHIRTLAEARDIELLVFNAGWDPSAQVTQIEQAIALGVDLILLCAADSLAMVNSVERLARRVPVITFTNGLGARPDGWVPGLHGHVGRDEYQAGRQLAQQLDRLDAERPRSIVLLHGAPGTTPQRLRQAGFADHAKSRPHWRVTAQIYSPGWSPEQVGSELDRLLAAGVPFDTVVAQFAAAAVTAERVLARHGGAPVDIVANGLNRGLQLAMTQGTVASTSYYSIADEGRTAMGFAADWLAAHKSQPQPVAPDQPVFKVVPQRIITRNDLARVEVEQ